MTVHQFVVVRTAFEGFHRWKDAPAEVAFLRDFHRHEFQVDVHLPVTHADRQLEFFTVKRKLDDFLQKWSGWANRFELSCEALAEKILTEFGAQMVKVSEDGENAGVALRTQSAVTVRRNDGTTEVKSAAQQVMVNTYARLVEPLLPSMKVRKNCFVGFECEGPDVGHKTLFVPGCVTVDQFARTLKKIGDPDTDDISRVYLGAGNVLIQADSPALHVLELMLTKGVFGGVEFDRRPMTIEVPDHASVFKGWPNLIGKASQHSTITLLTHRWQDLWRVGWIGPMFAKEVANGGVTWYARGSTTYHGTFLTHPDYAADREIEV